MRFLIQLYIVCSNNSHARVLVSTQGQRKQEHIDLEHVEGAEAAL